MRNDLISHAVCVVCVVMGMNVLTRPVYHPTKQPTYEVVATFTFL